MIDINNIFPILDQEVQNYANQFGCPELSRNLGQPFFTCKLNKVPTLIYPRPIVDGIIFDNPQFDNLKEHCRNTHKIIRLDIEIQNNVVVLVKEIIVTDLVSPKYKK
jgi:hypothetical protein